MILQELLDRAEQAASGLAGDAPQPADSDITAYVIYPHAVRAVYREQAKTGRHLDNLTSEYEIEVIDGIGDIPDEIFREYFDRSFMTEYQFASYVPFEDYGRYRFDEQMTYFATRGKKFLCSKEPGFISQQTKTVSIVLHGTTLTVTDGGYSVTDEGNRIRVSTAVGGVLFDAFIDTVDDADTLITTSYSPYLISGTAIIEMFDADAYRLNRSLTAVVTANQSKTISCATAAFTDADIGRRIRLEEAGDVIVDTTIRSVTSATVAVLNAEANATTSDATADISYIPHLLQAVGIPALPTDLCDPLELAPEVAEDVIVKIASVLRGEMPLQKLIEAGRG